MAHNICKLAILHTNDLHSHFERMPQVAGILERLRASRSAEEVLTVDIGDHLDRMRVETEGTNGRANVDVLNACGYEAVVLGNNEGLTYPRETIEESYRDARFTVLGSNLRESPSGRLPGWMEPYRIIHKNGLRIGLIGVTAYYPDFYSLIGWEVLEPFGITERYVRELRPQTDLLVVLSHLGLSHDRRMAREIAGIDLILGGHTHHLLETPEKWGSTFIAAAGKFGQYVGEIEIAYDLTERAVVSLTGRCLEVADQPGSRDVEALIAGHRQAGKARMAVEVARLAEPLAIDWDGESPLGNLLAAGLRRWTGAEIGLVNAGQILQGLREGGVSRERLLDICPSPINPCRMKLTGQELRQALEESLLDEFKWKPIRGYGFRGERLGTLCLDGMTVRYDSSAAPFCKITDVRIGSEPLEAERLYDVGTIDMFTFGIGYMSLQNGRSPVYYLPEFIRDVIADQLVRPEELARSGMRRWLDARTDACHQEMREVK